MKSKKNVWNSITVIAVVLTVLTVVMGGTVSADGSFTGWEMNLGEGLITGVGPFPSHGHISEYGYANFPAANDPDWGPAPDVNYINYVQIPSTLCNVCPCREGLEFTYFRTRVYIPSGATTFHVESGTVDDGLELRLNGIVRDHAYLGGYVSTNLLPYANLGAYNDLTIIHVDDCCYHSYLYNLRIYIDGEELTIALCPDEYRWNTSVSSTGYEWDPSPDLFRSWNDVHFVNTGTGDAYNVTANITCAPVNVNIVDGNVALGDIPAGGGAWSDDFFVLEVDMTNPQDPNKGICWRVEYDDATGAHHVIEDVAKYCGEECSNICP